MLEPSSNLKMDNLLFSVVEPMTSVPGGGGGGGGGGGHSLVSSVPMRDQKNDEKGYFFSRRTVRSADII